MLTLRWHLTENLFSIMFVSYLLGILVFGYVLRIAERPTNRLSGSEYWDYANSFWNCIITMPGSILLLMYSII